MLGPVDGIKKSYSEHQDLLIFALTGRTGSGCTTAANLLAEDFKVSLPSPSELSDPELRKYIILKNYCEAKWVKFTKITVSSLLLTFLFEEEWRDILKLNSNLSHDKSLTEKQLKALSEFIINTKPKINELTKLFKLNNKKFSSVKWDGSQDLKNIIHNKLPKALEDLKKILGNKYNIFFQLIGDNLRRSGTACDDQLKPENFFSLPRRIVRIIESIREIDKADKNNTSPTRIVIDAIRNPFELVYLRDRYSPLYAIAITVDEDHRLSRLVKNGYSPDMIASIDAKEYPKKHAPLDTYDALVAQDIQSCLQKADIFISNPGRESKSNSSLKTSTAFLYKQLTRYYALALHPGLITPTRDERCMQVAFVAKANSGCISRQVGAVVTDEYYAIKSIGWNDVPKGQVPCALRNVDDLIKAHDEVAYSQTERENDEFRRHLEEEYTNKANLEKEGLPCPYCFKDAINKTLFKPKDGLKSTNQVHTRSLHAEENAFLQLSSNGGANVKGGKLFTTASPCELCSKKAYQMGIKDIIYVDPYPGISIPHILMSGNFDTRPEVRLFSGSVGKAYHRLYEPMLPVKDEIIARLRKE